MGGDQCGVGPDHRAAPEGGGGLGAAADPVDGGADVRVAGEMPSVEQGPEEERPIVRGVRQVGYDPHDAQPASAQKNGCRVPLSNGRINSLMGQTLSRLQSLNSNIDHMRCSLSSKNSPRNTVDFEAACSVYIRFRGVNGYWEGSTGVQFPLSE